MFIAIIIHVVPKLKLIQILKFLKPNFSVLQHPMYYFFKKKKKSKLQTPIHRAESKRIMQYLTSEPKVALNL